MVLAQLSIVFGLQLLAIVAAARIVGWLGRRFLGQPRVVGEMIAGVLLGPSLFGLVAPDLQAALFPQETRGALHLVAQAGVGLYMFLVGLGFDRGGFRAQAAGAGLVAVAGMALPFVAAVALAPWLLGHPGLFGEGVGLLQATLFLGACISITAFPVLARILDERGLTHSPLGALTLSAGAFGDAGAWIVLALVIATLPGGAALGLDPGLAVVLGGFLAGLAVPRGALARRLKALVEPFTVAALVPLFFAFSGLNTRFDLAADPGLALVAVVVLAASILSKVGGGWAAARLTGQDNPTALAVGVLMNTRGMMELIILNIGLQRGLIGAPLFSVLVLMAVVTTFMASPLFELVYGRRARARGDLGALADAPEPTAPRGVEPA
jgi:Kef-type K+ transport system membrane component KefB